MLHEYNRIVFNIEVSNLPWDAERRKDNLKKLLRLDVLYLESHLKSRENSSYPEHSNYSDSSDYSDYSDNYSDPDDLNVNPKEVLSGLRTLSAAIRSLEVLMILEPSKYNNEHKPRCLLYRGLREWLFEA